MNAILLTSLVLFGISSFFFGKSRIKKIATSGSFRPKALPHFYGYYQALWCALPAFLILILWTILEPIIVKNLIENKLQLSSINELTKNELNLIYSQIVSLAQGNFSGQVTEAIKSGALTYKNLLSISHGAKAVLFFCAIIATSLFAYNKINKNVHARDGVEKIFTTVLFLSYSPPVLTISSNFLRVGCMKFLLNSFNL